MTRTQALIEEPKNPFVINAKELGSAELLAGGVNVGATYLATLLTGHPVALGLAGPIAEKIGFLAWEAKNAHARYRAGTTQPSTLIREGAKGLGRTLAADLCGHDPAYFLAMQAMLDAGMDPTLASSLSFLAGIPVAAAVQTATGEALHHGLKRLSERKGFRWESYFETRFLFSEDANPRRAFDTLSDAFNLSNYNTTEYHDTYFQHRVPAFGNRLGLVRMRTVEDCTGNGRTYTDLELSYVLGRRHTAPASEFNLFYAHKEKGWKEIRSLDDAPVLRALTRATDREIAFTRTIRHDDEIRTVLDEVVVQDRAFSVLEIKAYHDGEEFREAMRFLLRNSSAMTTTHPKLALAAMRW